MLAQNVPGYRKGDGNPMEYANQQVSFNPQTKSSALDTAVAICVANLVHDRIHFAKY